MTSTNTPLESRPEVLLHLGPPKTATTSLQMWYAENEALGYHYVGIRQPRPDTTLTTKILTTIRREDLSTDELLDLQQQVEELVASKGPLVFSEEMFLLHAPGADLKERLSRLGFIFKGLRTRVVFCVRDVQKVMFSFYQELYETLDQETQDDFHAFVQSPFCDCFRYQPLHQSILEAGFERTGVFYFDDLVAGRVDAAELCPAPISASVSVVLPRSNITSDKRPGSVAFRRGPIRRWMRKTLARAPLGLRQIPGLRALGLRFLRGKKKTLAPTALDEAVTAAYQQDLLYLGKESQPSDSANLS